MRNLGKYALMIILAVLAASSCGRESSNQAEKPAEQPVKTHQVVLIGEGGIHGEELKAYVSARSPEGAGPQIVDQALDELVVAELLYQEAVRMKIDQNPEVRQAIRQLLGHQLLNARINEPVMTREIFTEELREYYDTHPELYSRPEQVRLADIFIAVPPGGDHALFAEKKKEANGILAMARTVNSERFGFSRLVREYSDKHPGYRLGDTGFFDRGGHPGDIAKELIEVGFSLTRPGALADEVVQTSDGFHIIRLVARRPPFSQDFEAAARDIEQRIRKQELAEKRNALIASLRKQSRVEIQHEVLAKINGEIAAAHRRSAGKENYAAHGKPSLPAQ